MHRGAPSLRWRKVFPWRLSSYLPLINSHCPPTSRRSTSIYSTTIPKPLTCSMWFPSRRRKPKCPSATNKSKVHPIPGMNTTASDATIANSIRIQSSALPALMQATMNPIDLKKSIPMAVIVTVEIKLPSSQKDFARNTQVNPRTSRYHPQPKSVSIISSKKCFSGFSSWLNLTKKVGTLRGTPTPSSSI